MGIAATTGNGSIGSVIDRAKAEGVQFTIDDGELSIGIPTGKEHWRKKLVPIRADILRHLTGEPDEPPPPEPIEITPYKPIPLECFPEPIRDYIDAAATAIGCDAAFISLPLLACLARAIGNARTIRLKASWEEASIIWAAIVGKSGTHKTPAMNAATTILHRRERQAIQGHQSDLEQYEQDRALYDRDYAAWRKSKTTDPPPWKPEEPPCLRYTTSDATIEAVASLLDGQHDGLLVVRDELSGWINGIGEYKGGQGSDLGHWLACWSAAPMTVDRKTGAKRMIHIPRASVGIVGGIQPDILRVAIGREHMQDGLCQRLLLAWPEAKPVQWTEDVIPPEVEQRLERVFERLFELEPAADADGNPEPFPIDLATEAKERWVSYYNRHRRHLATLDDDLAAAASKLEAYAARFALIFQLVDWADGTATDGQIDECAMAAGIELSEWFEHEASRVYSLFHEAAGDREQRELLGLIRRRGGRISARDLMHASRKYRPTEYAETALLELAKAGYGTMETIETGGRPKHEFVLSPGVTVTTSA